MYKGIYEAHMLNALLTCTSYMNFIQLEKQYDYLDWKRSSGWLESW